MASAATPQTDGTSRRSARHARRVKLADVAAAADVSIKTVSRVVHNDPRIAPDTRGRVQAIIDELGYRPNLAARSLRSGADSVIGVIVDSVADPFFAAILGAIEDEMEEHGYAVLAASSKRHASRESTVLTRLAQRAVAGVIVVPTHLDRVPPEFDGTPFVFIDRLPAGVDADAVIVEDFEASYRAVNHLIEYGHRRIAFVGDYPEIETTKERLRGFSQALADAGIQEDENLVRADLPSMADAFVAVRHLMGLDEPPTAIFTAGSRHAQGMLTGMTEAERATTAVISFGDFAMAESMTPAMSAIQHDPERLAHEAVKLMLRRLKKPDAPTKVVKLELSMIERGSGELRPRD